jgi:hypothetical protein
MLYVYGLGVKNCNVYICIAKRSAPLTRKFKQRSTAHALTLPIQYDIYSKVKIDASCFTYTNSNSASGLSGKKTTSALV